MAGIRAASGLLRPTARSPRLQCAQSPCRFRRVSLAALGSGAVGAEVLLRCLVPSASATAALATALWRSGVGSRGDVILLRGEVGAGKSSLARALIRAAYDDPFLPVPSPTYTLEQRYTDYASRGSDAPAIHHYDLYRLDRSSPLFVDRIGLSDSFRSGVCLVEWAERLEDFDQRSTAEGVTGPAYAPEVALDVGIETVTESEDEWLLRSTGFDARGARKAGWEDPLDDGSGDTRPRVVTLSGVGSWEPRWREVVETLAADVRSAQSRLQPTEAAAPRVIEEL